MKFGIIFANAGPRARAEDAVAMARDAEAAGFESIWTVEHVVVPAGYESEYPYSADGRMPGGEDVDIPDPLVWLSWVGAVTTTLKLATGILILPQRNPVVLAKELATLDLLSGGRVMLGVGVGWLREEFDAIGVPFEERAARTDEYVEALRRLRAGQEPPQAGAGGRHPDRRRWPHQGRSPPGRSAGRRLLPGAGDDRRPRPPARRDAPSGQGRRP